MKSNGQAEGLPGFLIRHAEDYCREGEINEAITQGIVFGSIEAILFTPFSDTVIPAQTFAATHCEASIK